MSAFVVRVSSVQAVSAATSTAAEQLRAEWLRLRTEVDAVLAGSWSGVAATAFEQAWTEWDDAARGIIATLDDLAGRLGDSGAAYEASDATGADTLARLVL